MTEIHAAAIGQFARTEVLPNSSSAAVTGVTSRGAFLKTTTRWLLFLSREQYRGPLTINLPTAPDFLAGLALQASVQIREGALGIPSAKTTIRLENAQSWQPAPPTGGTPAAPLQALLSAIHADEWQPLFYLLVNPGEKLSTPRSLPRTQAVLYQTTVQLLQHKGPQKVSRILEQLLGLGDGLTPLGDDYIAGFLLALNRFNGQNPAIAALNHTIIKQASHRTTTLSANLIELAARAQADERLVAACDALYTGSHDWQTALAPLLAWGGSSGLGALAGMLASLTLNWKTGG